MLETVAAVSLTLAVTSAIVIVAHLCAGHRQHMWIMNLVWPLTALWAGPLGAYAYFRYGRAAEARGVARARERGQPPPSQEQPNAILVAKGTTHCGSACTLGDLTAELLAVVLPLSLFGHHIFGAWLYDLLFAFAFGVLFQYFTIKPMRELSRREGLKQALKADTLSLMAWQVGMYGWMAIATFVIFQHELPQSSPILWLMMQVAMFLGFAPRHELPFNVDRERKTARVWMRQHENGAWSDWDVVADCGK